MTSPGSVEIGQDRIVLRLPDPRILLIVSRSVLLTAAIISFPWLRAAVMSNSNVPAPAATGQAARAWIDDPFVLPMLLRDLQRNGLLKPGDRAVILGGVAERLPVLRQYGIELIGWKRVIVDSSVDFVLAADGFGDPNLNFIDRVLRIGGVTVVRLGAEPAQAFRMPANYRLAYIRRFGSTIVAIKKMAHTIVQSPPPHTHTHTQMGRRLMSVARRETTVGLEGAMMEPPRKGSPAVRTMYLPELMGEEWLDGYTRRVFVDVVAGNADSRRWFEENYPKAGREFDTVRVDAAAGAVAEWLSGSVAEDFVVMKAEAGVVEELLGRGGGGVIGFVDELFLECKNEWQKGSRSRRAYWQCVNLYGRLRDEGVAVHQWWG